MKKCVHLDVDPFGEGTLLVKHAEETVVGQGVAAAFSAGAKARLHHVGVAALQHLGGFGAGELRVRGCRVEGGQVPKLEVAGSCGE